MKDISRPRLLTPTGWRRLIMHGFGGLVHKLLLLNGM